jgi:hypothetical protein
MMTALIKPAPETGKKGELAEKTTGQKEGAND